MLREQAGRGPPRRRREVVIPLLTAEDVPGRAETLRAETLQAAKAAIVNYHRLPLAWRGDARTASEPRPPAAKAY